MKNETIAMREYRHQQSRSIVRANALSAIENVMTFTDMTAEEIRAAVNVILADQYIELSDLNKAIKLETEATKG